MFSNLTILKTHLDFLKSKLPNKDIFLVGGCIRDILLGIDFEPKDIDFTCAGNPLDLSSQIDKNNCHFFMTEKFGTITLLPKTGQFKKIKYELTPLRQEGNYEDFRHPGEIARTDDLVADAKRRDFTINCIYYHSADIDIQDKSSTKIDFEKLAKILKKDGYIYLSDSKTLILQNHQIISQTFPKSQRNNEYLIGLLDKSEYYTFQDNNSNSESISIIIDPFFGIDDIISFNIKAVGNPDDRFTEDALRVIRALRFVNVLNVKLKKHKKENFFNIDNETRESMKKNSYLVQHVAKERIKEEIFKVFKENNPFAFVSLLDKIDILKFIFPSIYLTKNIDQPIRYHPFDVFNHTLLCLYYVQSINKDPLVKFGILYHDIGKPEQYSQVTEGMTKEQIRQISGSELHHPNIGEKMVHDELKKSGFSKKETDMIALYVKQHMLIGEILKSNPENLEKKVKKLLSNFGYKVTLNLIDITIADRLGQFNPVQPTYLNDVKNLKKIVKKIYKEQGAFHLQDMNLNGNDLIQEFGIKPGPQIGILLNTAFEWVLEDVSTRNHRQEILNFLKSQKNN